MKKIMTLMLGLALIVGTTATVSFAADEKPAGEKKGKKKGGKKDEKKDEKK